MKFRSSIHRLISDQSGASMTEYALILSLLSAAAMAMLIAISKSASASLTTTTSNMQSYQMGPPP